MYVKFHRFPYISPFFSDFNHDLSCTLILPVSQLETQQVMTSQIWSHKIFNTNPNNIIVLILYSQLMKTDGVFTT